MRPLDPVTYLAVLALMSNVALVTYALPARAATSMFATLREE